MWELIGLLILVFLWLGAICFPDLLYCMIFSPFVFLSALFSPDIIPFLEKREKKSVFSQISFLKKKLRRKKWREIFEECLMDCRTEDIGEKYYGELYGNNKYLRPSFREFWSLSSNPSFFSEKEREWVREIEWEVEERIEKRKMVF